MTSTGPTQRRPRTRAHATNKPLGARVVVHSLHSAEPVREPGTVAPSRREPGAALYIGRWAPKQQRPGASRYPRLKLALARLQLELNQAQQNAGKALQAVVTEETREELEQLSYVWLEAIYRGYPARDVDIQAWLDTEPSPTDVHQFLNIIEAQRRVVSASLPDPRDRFDFDRESEALLIRVAGMVLNHWPAAPVGQWSNQAGSATNQAAALAQILKVSRQASQGRYRPVPYPDREGTSAGNAPSYRKVHIFTNEAGSPKTVRRLDFAGGAAVGVGGAMLDIGSMGAGMIVVTDAQPLLCEAIFVITALLLAVDRQAQAEKLNEQQQARRVRQWLAKGADPAVMNSIAELGLPSAYLGLAGSILNAIRDKLNGLRNPDAPPEAQRIPEDLWCRGPDSTQRIMHLTRLALEGRILAVMGDISDPFIVDRINEILDRYETEATVFRISNLLDYTPNPRSVLANLGFLKRDKDAVLVTSVGRYLQEELQPLVDYVDLAALGHADEPAVLAAESWIGLDREAARQRARLHNALWRTKDYVDRVLAWTQESLHLEPKIDVRPSSKQHSAATTFKSRLDRAVKKAFKNRDYARRRLRQVLFAMSRAAAYALVTGDETSLENGQNGHEVWAKDLDRFLPKDTGDVEVCADQFDAEFWKVEGRKEVMLRHALGDACKHIDARDIEACATVDDLKDLVLQARISAMAQNTAHL